MKWFQDLGLPHDSVSTVPRSWQCLHDSVSTVPPPWKVRSISATHARGIPVPILRRDTGPWLTPDSFCNELNRIPEESTSGPDRSRGSRAGRWGSLSPDASTHPYTTMISGTLQQRVYMEPARNCPTAWSSAPPHLGGHTQRSTIYGQTRPRQIQVPDDTRPVYQ